MSPNRGKKQSPLKTNRSRTKDKGADIDGPTSRFVMINEYDPEHEQKKRLVFLIVAVLVAILLFFWLWTLKDGLKQKILTDKNSDRLSKQIGESFSTLGQNLDQVKTALKEASESLAEQNELSQIKDEVLDRIKNNLSSSNWLTNTSTDLGLSLKYPGNWLKTEKDQVLTLTLSTNATTTQNQKLVEIIITEAVKKFELPDQTWTKNGQLFPANRVVDKYTKSDLSSNQTFWLIQANYLKQNYQIVTTFSNSGSLYEPLVEKIINTVIFFKKS